MMRTMVVANRLVKFQKRFFLQSLARRNGSRGLELQVLIGGKSGSWSRQVLATRMNQTVAESTSMDRKRILEESRVHQASFCGWQIFTSAEFRYCRASSGVSPLASVPLLSWLLRVPAFVSIVMQLWPPLRSGADRFEALVSFHCSSLSLNSLRISWVLISTRK